MTIIRDSRDSECFKALIPLSLLVNVSFRIVGSERSSQLVFNDIKVNC